MFIYNPINLNLDNIEFPCDNDYARLFIHILLKKTIFSKREFIPLKASILRKSVHLHVGRIKDILVENGIIDCDFTYYPKQKCYGFKLCDKYKNQRIKKIKVFKKCILKKLDFSEPEISTTAHQGIWKWLNEVEIDEKLAYSIINKSNKHSKKYMLRSFFLEKLIAKDLFLKTDPRGRVYHNVNNIWSRFRKLLAIKGEKLIEVDVCNSQPILFSILINYYLLSHPIHDVSFLDIKRFVELTETGEFYDFLMDGFSFSRKSMKKQFFAEVLYSKVAFSSPFNSKFKSLFPNVQKIIDYYKRDSHVDLALLLQKTEADIMIGQVCSKLHEMGNIPFIPIHDSIMTTTSNVQVVKEVITDAFANVGLRPSFGV